MQDFAANALPALGLVTAPLSLLLIATGLLAGIVMGILPGFGGAQALALMFPFTFLMPAEGAILFMVAIYSAAEYGGSIPAILIRTPGTSAAAMTVLDGYPMAKSGRARRALMISVTAGVFGGLLSSIIFLLAATALAWIGLQFGPSEMFAVGVFGLAIIGSFVGRDPTKGFIAAAFGLLLSTIGSSGFGGMRFDFGQSYLADGIPLVVMIIAMLAAPEVFEMMRKLRQPSQAPLADEAMRIGRESRFTLRDLAGLLPTYVRGTVIGTAVGALPGPGPTVAALLAYNEERRWSKRGAQFGTGVDEGVGAPESANNAVVAGALVPALALGVPGSGAIAVLIGVLISKGIVPGPTLFTEGGPLVLAIFFGLIAANLMLLVLGIFGVRLLVPIARVPAGLLAPFVFVLLIVGAYAHDHNIAHSFMVIGLGAFAYLIDKLGFSPVPLLLGFIMGPIIEQNLNRALIISTGDLSEVFLRPITLTILVLAVLTAIFAYRRGQAYG
jgi:putative tricarboxylic transport membrane protein